MGAGQRGAGLRWVLRAVAQSMTRVWVSRTPTSVNDAGMSMSTDVELAALLRDAGFVDVDLTTGTPSVYAPPGG